MTIDKARTPGAKRGTLPAFAPVPRHYKRHDGWTPERQLGFIEALADTGSVRAAANAVNMAPEGAYLLRRHPEAAEFRKAWESALALGVQRIEDVAMDRALNGVELPVYSYGKIVGTRISYNDRLLMFMLRNRAPKRFTEGGARGLNAVDGKQLKRLKTEWEKEHNIHKVAPAEVRASIERKIEAFRKSIQRNTSQKAIELDQLATAQRHADLAAGWRAGLPYAPFEEEATRLLPECLAKVKADWPEPEPPAEEWEDGEDAWEDRERDNAPLALPGPDGG